jgi:flagellar transcriptional activator FlhD
LQNATVERDIICEEGESKMHIDQIHEEIRETNLSYMLLAQQMLQNDRVSAIFRLGISEEMADLISGLTTAQILKMAGSNMMLCRFRFDERLMLNMISDFNKDRMMSQAHATILMTAQPVEALAA